MTLLRVTDAKGFITLHEPDEDGNPGDLVASVWRDDWLDRLTATRPTPDTRPAAAGSVREVNPMTDSHINWLVHQLEAWPTRVDPEKTTNIQYLMGEAARLIRRQPLAAAPTPDAAASDAAVLAGEDEVRIPREPTEAMMDAGLYHSSHDTEWSDVNTMWKAMFDAVTLDGGSSTHALAAAPKVASDTDAAASEAGEVAIQSLVSAWHGGWSYEFGPHNVPNGPIEVAFDAGLGFTHVKICERFITRSMATYDRPLPVDQYEYGYRDQDGKDVSDSCRAYAWRKIALPPHPRPFDDGPRDVESYIHNFCPDKVRDHFAALTARAALTTQGGAEG